MREYIWKWSYDGQPWSVFLLIRHTLRVLSNLGYRWILAPVLNPWLKSKILNLDV
ncbi:hypothetical protein BX600DRAFT_142825 [Xylariales sp. PMI_506]|nr:hypothetical protein BX600DRAFT_142825 [Xylariales sp. PMI_506]